MPQEPTRVRMSIAATAVAAAMLLSSCAASEPEGSQTPGSPAASSTASSQPATADPTTPAAATPDPQPTGITITSGSSDYGRILIDADDQAIYIFELETSAEPECYGDCARAWPPVLTEGDPVAAGAVDSSLVGTTTRRDGSQQVTYSDHPLYYYADEDPGEVRCHNVATHGGLWWVIKPNGNRAA